VVCLGELEAGVLLAATAETRASRLRRLTAVTASVPALIPGLSTLLVS